MLNHGSPRFSFPAFASDDSGHGPRETMFTVERPSVKYPIASMDTVGRVMSGPDRSEYGIGMMGEEEEDLACAGGA